MATSNSRTSRTTRSTRTPAQTPRVGTGDRRTSQADSRRLRYYTFQYSRDDKAHGKGSNSVRITDRTSNGSVELTLQEARSLFNFLNENLG